jgi:hypothetical protein
MISLIESDAIKLLRGGADHETLLRFMRDQGLGIAPSAHLLAKLGDISLADAQVELTNSETWSDQREGLLGLQHQLLQAFEESGVEVVREDEPES